jgi:hypothetical protein
MESVTISTHILLPKGLKDPDNKMALDFAANNPLANYNVHLTNYIL